MPYAYVGKSSNNINKELISAILTNDKIAEEEKSELIANIMDKFNTEYPELKYHATKQDVTETELKLTKEIENTRKEIKELDVKLTKEIKELDVKLTKEIENTRKEIKELDVKLSKEIKELDVKLSKEIKETKASMIKWSFLFWISQMGALLGIGFFVLKALSMK